MLLIHSRGGRSIRKDYEPAYNGTNTLIWIKMLISKCSFSVSRGPSLSPFLFLKTSYLKFSSLFLINNTRVPHLSAFHLGSLPWVAARTSVDFFRAHGTLFPTETMRSFKECLASFDFCSFLDPTPPDRRFSKLWSPRNEWAGTADEITRRRLPRITSHRALVAGCQVLCFRDHGVDQKKGSERKEITHNQRDSMGWGMNLKRGVCGGGLKIWTTAPGMCWTLLLLVTVPGTLQI